MTYHRSVAIAIGVGSLWIFCSAAGAQEITVGERTLVSRAPDGWAIVEPHLALDPRNPNRVLAVAILTPAQGSFEEKGDQQTCRAVRSEDAGRTWRHHNFLMLTWCYDPWLAFTPAGEAVLALSARHAAIDSIGREGGLFIFHSADGGGRWRNLPSVLRRSPDHPTVAVDTTRSKWRGYVYVMSGTSIQVARSKDGGRTFSSAVRVTPNNLINLAEKPAVLSNGTLVLSFVDAGWRRDSTGSGYFKNRRSWIVRSTDGGESFSAPFFITDACGQPPHFQQSFLVVDHSTAFRDRLYFACRRVGGGPIVVAYSSDSGSRWSDPVPVSAEADDSTVARVVAMAVNPAGVLAIAWIVGRPAVPCHEVFFTASVDGGRSFLRPKRIAAPACASAAWSTSGDYFGLVASPTGVFHLMWGEPEGASGILVHATVIVEPSVQ